jgi:hypothetical protein
MCELIMLLEPGSFKSKHPKAKSGGTYIQNSFAPKALPSIKTDTIFLLKLSCDTHTRYHKKENNMGRFRKQKLPLLQAFLFSEMP